MTIVALGVHHLNNVHTLSAVFGRELTDPAWVAQRRAHAVEVVTRYAAAAPGGPRTEL